MKRSLGPEKTQEINELIHQAIGELHLNYESFDGRFKIMSVDLVAIVDGVGVRIKDVEVTCEKVDPE